MVPPRLLRCYAKVRLPQRMRYACKAQRIVKPQLQIALQADVDWNATEPGKQEREMQPMR